MADLAIRTARPGDFDAVDAIFRASYPVLLAPDYDAATLAATLPAMARAQPKLLTSGTYYVAVLDGRICGAGGWTAETPGTGALVPGLAHVRHLTVDYRVTRCGIARALLVHTFEAARRAGFKRMDCVSTRTAVPFYQAMGFERLEDTVVPIDKQCPFPAVRMTRVL